MTGLKLMLKLLLNVITGVCHIIGDSYWLGITS